MLEVGDQMIFNYDSKFNIKLSITDTVVLRITLLEQLYHILLATSSQHLMKLFM